jgi:hypothetical protein
MIGEVKGRGKSKAGRGVKVDAENRFRTGEEHLMRHTLILIQSKLLEFGGEPLLEIS